MSRWLLLSLKAIVFLLALLAVVWLGFAYYLHQNHQTVLNAVTHQFNSKITGKVTVASMETTLLKSFPSIGVALKKVSLKDSLWQKHKHQLLNADEIEVALNPFALLVGNISISKISINHAKIYLYTDSTGYSNTHIFKSNASKTNEKESGGLAVSQINLNHVALVVDNQKKLKLFHFLIEEIKGKINYTVSGWNGKIGVKTTIKSMAFNTTKGSFLKNSTVKGLLKAQYSKQTNLLTVYPSDLWIADNKFNVGAKLKFDKQKTNFTIGLKASKILYRDISLMLAQNISSKLLKFGIDKPIAVNGTISDYAENQSDDPHINVKIQVKNSTVSFPSGKLNHCNFVGTFNNQSNAQQTIGDENSVIRLYRLTGNYFNAPLRVDTLAIVNLARPIASGLVTSKFNLRKLNKDIASETFKFNQGTADLKLFCKADIENFRFTKPIISGMVAIKNADIVYLPRQMKFTNSSLFFNFNQNNLNLTNSSFQLGKSILKVNGTIAHFLNLYYTAPEKIQVNLKLNSPQLHLSQLIPLLSMGSVTNQKVNVKNSLQKASHQLTRVLSLATINLHLNVDKAIYNRFVAQQLRAKIALANHAIQLSEVQVKHAGGYLHVKGNIKQTGKLNQFTLATVISKVNVKAFFYAFDNFGQQTITHQNLKGFLSAKVNARGSLTSSGNLVSKTMFGIVHFNLNKAGLTNFEPLKKVQKLVFPNRDLANIAIDHLNGQLNLNGDQIIISPMQVNSSALNFNVKGIYGFNEGTNIALDIPLRNPKKDEVIRSDAAKKEARMKGIVLHLKAVDDGKGGVKVRWNNDHD